MGAQIMQLSSELKRNDPCLCGSGKKYKKCCLPKDQEREQLKRELEEIKDVTDNYFPTKVYIEESGYPVNMFDYLMLEILNIIGEILHTYHKLKFSEITETLFVIFKEAKMFYASCLQCEYACLNEPMKEINFQSLFDQGLQTENYPEVLQRRVSINFFYFEFINVIDGILSDEICKIIHEKEAEEIVSTVHNSILDFVADNCWGRCSNKCMKEHSENAYCNFCSFGVNNLPCPKKGEITYAEIKANEEDMLH